MQTIKDLLRRPSKYRGQSEISELTNADSVEELAKKLPADEEVLRIVKGFHNGHIGALAATNKRVVFVSKGIMNKFQFDFDYLSIGSAVTRPRIFTSDILVHNGGSVFVISKVTRRHARRFARFVNRRSDKEQQSYIKGKIPYRTVA